METKLSQIEWEHTYLLPISFCVENNERPSGVMADGFAGFVLDGILAIRDVDPEQSNDWECVEMVAELVRVAMKLHTSMEEN